MVEGSGRIGVPWQGLTPLRVVRDAGDQLLHARFRYLLRVLGAGAALVFFVAAGQPAARAASGTGTLTGANTAITAGWRGTAAGAEFLSRCMANATVGSVAPAVPASNGAGAWVIDLGAERTGFVSVAARVPATPVGPAIPTPDPTRLIFQSPTYQLQNFDLDLYFVNARCTQVGSAATQAANDAGSITTPARYVVVLLAFNATGSPSVTFDYSAP